jgi:hypothetical protein
MSNKYDKLNINLKTLSVRDFPVELHQWLKVEAAKKGVTIAEFLIEVCVYWQETHKSQD